jgi:tol-pal system protein YbgF
MRRPYLTYARSIGLFGSFRGPLLAAACFACLPSVAGCASRDAEEKQLASLRDEISRVQSASDTFSQRLDKLEVSSADVHSDGRGPDATAEPALSPAAPVATPPLRVVHIGADGEEEAGDTGETAGAVGSTDEPRVRIQGSGADATVSTEASKRRGDAPGTSSGATRSFTNANLGSSLAAHSGSRPSTYDDDAKHSYDAALTLVNAKHYAEAREALAGFLVKWPDHPMADNAMYWRGECYFAQGDYANAAQEFEGLLSRFPAGNKASDALLKLGISKRKLGDNDAARQRFDRLRREFPKSEAARHIPAGAETVRVNQAGQTSAPTSGDTP